METDMNTTDKLCPTCIGEGIRCSVCGGTGWQKPEREETDMSDINPNSAKIADRALVEAVRKRTALEHLAEGHPLAKVAGAAEVSTRTVRRWAKDAGVSIPSGPGKGRPRSASLDDDQLEALRVRLAPLGFDQDCNQRQLLFQLGQAIASGRVAVVVSDVDSGRLLG